MQESKVFMLLAALSGLVHVLLAPVTEAQHPVPSLDAMQKSLVTSLRVEDSLVAPSEGLPQPVPALSPELELESSEVSDGLSDGTTCIRDVACVLCSLHADVFSAVLNAKCTS